MQTTHFEEYLEKYKDTQLKIDSYLIRRMNLIANQTTARLGDYNMAGALAMISFTEAQLIAVLSPNEITHFNRFVAKASTLILAFEKPGIKEPVRFHLRVSLVSITPLPNRANICLIKLQLKMLPPEFMTLLCDVLDDIESRKQAYENLCQDMMVIDPNDFVIAAIKPKGELGVGATKILIGINAISTCRAKITLESWPFAPDIENRFSLKLVGIPGSFSVPCCFDGEIPGKAGSYEMKLDFSNELIFNIEEWKTRLTIRSRSARTTT
jgi:hypothetical protein